MKNLLKYFTGYRKEAILSPLFKLTEALLELCVPLLVASIIDQAIPSQDLNLLFLSIGGMFAIALIGLGFALTAQYFAAKAAIGFTRNLSEDLFQRIIYLSRTSIKQISSASLISRLTNDTFQIQNGLNRFFRLFLRSPFIVFGSLVMAMQIDHSMTVIFLSMVICLFIVVYSLIYWINPIVSGIRQEFDRLVQITREQVRGIRVIRAFLQEEREFQEFQSLNDQLIQDQIDSEKRNAWMNPLTFLIVNISLILVIRQGGFQVNLGHISQGQLVALVNYLLAILVELIKLANIVMTLNRSWASAKRVNQVLEIQEEDQSWIQKSYSPIDSTRGGHPVTVDTAIVVDNLSFTYPDAEAPTLEAIDFVVQKGDFFGIVGSTGAGKSSLLYLLTGFYRNMDGAVSFNPRLFDTSNLQTLRQEMSVVSGEVALLQGTIRSNLQLAAPQASDQEMWQALEDAQAKDFVAKLKGGLDAPVEAFGRNFSGGQRQRLTIARALLRPGQLLIFDDATSALDYLTEARLYRVLNTKYQDLTKIIISQRTHSFVEADQILILEQGHQVGLGSHQELLENNRVYQEIYHSQHLEEVES
ncbi:ABC transporter ATP-binding protein [Hutsoniella sourekii]|uniref:ABC transporter ATP-binding protein n=1 Tax=Hutsoniella sourekii TaxID=87650 RepID=UPI0004825C77|nr:ABC transporter ATP-binding protein [Hutsoniella sourekii]